MNHPDYLKIAEEAVRRAPAPLAKAVHEQMRGLVALAAVYAAALAAHEKLKGGGHAIKIEASRIVDAVWLEHNHRTVQFKRTGDNQITVSAWYAGFERRYSIDDPQDAVDKATSEMARAIAWLMSD